MRSQWTGSPAPVKMSSPGRHDRQRWVPADRLLSPNHPRHDSSVWKRPVPRYGRTKNTRDARPPPRGRRLAHIRSHLPACRSPPTTPRRARTAPASGKARADAAPRSARHGTGGGTGTGSGRPGRGTTSGFERAISVRSAADPCEPTTTSHSSGISSRRIAVRVMNRSSTLRQAPQELVPHVVHDHPVVATEPARRRIPGVVFTDRQAGREGSSRPAILPSGAHERDRSVGHIEADTSNQLGGLLLVHREIAVVELEEPARGPKPRGATDRAPSGMRGRTSIRRGRGRSGSRRCRARWDSSAGGRRPAPGGPSRRTGPSPSSVPARASPARESPSSSVAGAARDRAGGSHRERERDRRAAPRGRRRRNPRRARPPDESRVPPWRPGASSSRSPDRR